MPKSQLTRAFKDEKSRFLSSYGENPRLATAVKQLMRKLAQEPSVPSGKSIGALRVPSGLGVRGYRWLACFFVINPKTGDIAPFYLCFPEQLACMSIDGTDMDKLLKAVLDELGWN